ncbi:homeobox-leucine zipper protein ATHB-15-like [Panicum miliaceum]|jgi:hypothetical protein|uniref:Homeobox-leucine zipper protein ATHB-15-like n=1 Tax=Panicum miliaceum TaxID=4540 RepID=A0A3L6R5F3_PANMI|nr:homeobox-leucine zipper protein ATHB-15-like [Panicum miliaceum]
MPVFTFTNQLGLDMLETTLVALQDITLEKLNVHVLYIFTLSVRAPLKNEEINPCYCVHPVSVPVLMVKS